MDKILVTGATGFVGSHLVERLIKEGKNIRCLVLEKDYILGDALGKQRESILRDLGAEIVYGDLTDKKSVENAVRGVSKVFHLGAIGRPMNVPKEMYFKINVQGTKNLLEACRKERVQKIIHISSMSVFGFSRDGKPLVENSPKIPVSDYGWSKKESEELVLDFCRKNNLSAVVIRPPMIFGPRDFQFLKLFKGINTGLFPLLKKGRAKFEFCYVKNLIEAIILADKKGKNLEAYNINDGTTYTIKEVFKKIAELERKKLLPMPVWFFKTAGFLVEITFKLFGKMPPFNSGTASWMSHDNPMDISKAKKELGYKNFIPLDKSLKETIEWYKKEGLL